MLLKTANPLCFDRDIRLSSVEALSKGDFYSAQETGYIIQLYITHRDFRGDDYFP
jgi:hypothetical protein